MGLSLLPLHTFEDCKDFSDGGYGGRLVYDSRQCLDRKQILHINYDTWFDLSSEIVKELAIARKLPNKTFVFFRHRSMGRKIRVDLGGKCSILAVSSSCLLNLKRTATAIN